MNDAHTTKISIFFTVKNSVGIEYSSVQKIINGIRIIKCKTLLLRVNQLFHIVFKSNTFLVSIIQNDQSIA